MVAFPGYNAEPRAYVISSPVLRHSKTRTIAILRTDCSALLHDPLFHTCIPSVTHQQRWCRAAAADAADAAADADAAVAAPPSMMLSMLHKLRQAFSC